MRHNFSTPDALSRRSFLGASATAAAGAAAWGLAPGVSAAGFRSPNERPVCGFIGCGIRYGGLINEVISFGPAAAVCDVDTHHLGKAVGHAERLYRNRGVAPPLIDTAEDYRRILDRSDIDTVVIATPDHWHAKIVIEALRAGKHVYCEKPLTHNVAEGQAILKALNDSGRTMQVGTQQRSGSRFRTAVALARSERLGKVKRVTCGIGGCPTTEALPAVAPPSGLNWNRWLGPAPWTSYVQASGLPDSGYGDRFPFSRAHAHFRWWYEYAGGKLTDWGAHHVDIAMWGLGKSDGDIGAFTIDPIKVEHPVEFADGVPLVDDRFNTATAFEIRVTFADGVELDIVDRSERLDFGNGIMFECDQGRFFVNRGKLTGAPVEALAEDPLPESAYEALYNGPETKRKADDHAARGGSHVENFFRCVKSGAAPVSDVASHHRHLSVCHVANIAARLGRKLTFDPAAERFVDDAQADALLSREYRSGFAIEG